MGACRTWPGSGQPAEGGESCGSSWQGLPVEREPRRSVTQSWAYHGHRSLCSQSLGLCSTTQLRSSLCQATASAGFDWGTLGFVVSFFGYSDGGLGFSEQSCRSFS